MAINSAAFSAFFFAKSRSTLSKPKQRINAMSAILLLPLALVLGFPFMVGVIIGSRKLYGFVKNLSSKKTATIVVFCVLAAAAGIMTAPYWVLGTYGYLATVSVYVLFVGLGVPKFSKILRFLTLELDGDSGNDVDVPDGE